MRGIYPVPDCAQPVKKILEVMVDPLNGRDLLLPNQVVKDGILQIQIFYVSGDDLLRYSSLEMPFQVRAGVPGVQTGMHMQNQITRI